MIATIESLALGNGIACVQSLCIMCAMFFRLVSSKSRRTRTILGWSGTGMFVCAMYTIMTLPIAYLSPPHGATQFIAYLVGVSALTVAHFAIYTNWVAAGTAKSA